MISLHTGEFRTVPHSVEGKWFAETEADAAAWGTAFARFSLIAHDRIVMIEVEAALAENFFHVEKLDNIGPAHFATIEQLKGVIPREVQK